MNNFLITADQANYLFQVLRKFPHESVDEAITVLKSLKPAEEKSDGKRSQSTF